MIRAAKTQQTRTLLAAALVSASLMCTMERGPLPPQLMAAIGSETLRIGGNPGAAPTAVVHLDEAAQLFHVKTPDGRLNARHESTISALTGEVRIRRTDSSAGVTLSRGRSAFVLQHGIELARGVVFSARGGEAAVVLTPRHDGVEEDVVLTRSFGDSLELEYQLALDPGLSAELDSSGAVRIYGPRDDPRKRHEPLYSLPAPEVRDSGGVRSTKLAHFELTEGRLAVVAHGLSRLAYPITIDPTITVSGSSLAYGGNAEGGVDVSLSGLIRRVGFGYTGWGVTTSLPNARSLSGAAAYNGYLYSVGANGAGAPDVEYTQIYGNGIASPWTSTHAPPSVRYGAGVVAYNGYLFAVGGAADTAGTSPVTTVSSAQVNSDGTLGAFASIAPLPSARYGAGVAAWGGFLYSVGGLKAGNVPTTEVLVAQHYSDGTTGAWSASGSGQLPVALQQHSLVAYKGWLYALGGGSTFGSAGSSIYSAPLNSDGTVGTWSLSTTALPQATRLGGAYAYAGYLYSVGGIAGGTDSAAVYGASIRANGSLGAFIQTGSFGTARDSAGVAATGDGYAMIVGGSASGTPTADVQFSAPARAHEPLTTASWNATAQTLPVTTSQGCAVVVNGNIYVLGGAAGASQANTNSVYSASVADLAAGTTSSWTIQNGMPYLVSGHTCEVDHGFIYVIGGFITNVTPSTQTTVQWAQVQADGSLGSWSSSTTALLYNRWHHASAVYGGYLFITGGVDANAIHTEVYPLLSTGGLGTRVSGACGISTGPCDLPAARYAHAMVAFGGVLYLSGGNSGPAVATTLSTPIGTTGTMNSWSSGSSLPTGRYGHAMVVHDGTLYAVGGQDATSLPISDVAATQVESTSSGGSWAAWKSLPQSLPTARRYPMSVMFDGLLYAIGGETQVQGNSPVSVNDVSAILVDSAGGTAGFVQQSPTSVFSTRYAAGAAYANGYLYLVGGSTTAGSGNREVWYAQAPADGSVNPVWTRSSFNLPQPLFGHVSFVANSRLFVVGGFASGGVASSNIYSAPLGTAGELSSGFTSNPTTLNTGRGFLGAAYLPPSASNAYGTLYVAGGATNYSSGSNVPTVEYGALTSSGSVTMTTAATGFNLPFSGYNSLGLVATQTNAYGSLGYLWAIGGNTGQASSNKVGLSRVFVCALAASGAPTSPSWNDVTPLPFTLEGHGVTYYNGHVYVAGGESDTIGLTGAQVSPPKVGQVLAAPIDPYAGTLGNWAPMGEMGAAHRPAVTVGNGVLYSLGGTDNTGANTSNVYSAVLRTQSPTGYYSRLFNLNDQGVVYSAISGLTITGSATPQGSVSASYRTSLTNAMGSLIRFGNLTFGSPRNSLSTSNGTSAIWLQLLIDDSGGAFPLTIANSSDQVSRDVSGLTLSYAATSSSAVLAPTPTSATAGDCVAYTVTSYDGLGNEVPVYTSGGGLSVFLSSSPVSSATFYSNATCTTGITSFVINNEALLGGSCSSTTDPTCQASLWVKPTTAGTLTLKADVSNQLVNPTSTAQLTVNPGAASAIAYSAAPQATVAGSTLAPVTVQVVDPYGNATATSGVSITLSLSNGAALGGTTTLMTNSGGAATFGDLTTTKTGQNILLVATPNNGFATASALFSVTAAARNQLVVTQAAPNLTAGTAPAAPFLTVAVEDQYGNVVPNDGTDITLSLPGLVTVGGTATVNSGSSGIATFSAYNVTTATTGSQTYKFQINSGVLAQTLSNAFTVAPGPASLLSFSQQPSAALAHASIAPSVSVAVLDTYGNLVPSYSGPVTIAIFNPPGGVTLNGTTSQNASSGIATFPGLSIDKIGSYALLANAVNGGTNLSSAISNNFTISAAADSGLVFSTAIPNSTGGATLTNVSVIVQDAYGNPTGTTPVITVAFNANPGGAGTLSGTKVVTASNGTASFTTLSVDVAASSYQLKATSGTLTPGVSTFFNVTVGPAAKLAFTSAPATVIAKQGFSATVAVQDAGGNTVTSSAASVTLGFFANPNGDTLGGVLTASAFSGFANFNGLTLSKLGSGTVLRASSGTLAAGASAPITVTYGTATQLAFTTQPSAGTSGTALSPSVVVSIEDANGYVVGNATNSVTLSLSSGPSGGALTGTLAVAASAGQATFSNVLLDKVGLYTLQASAPSVGTGAIAPSSGITISAGSTARIAFVQQPVTTTAGTTLAAVAVQTQDAAGNPTALSGASVTLSLLNGGGATLNGTLVTTTSGAGGASFGDLTLTTAATGYQLKATTATHGTATSAAFNITPGPRSQLVVTHQPPDLVAGSAPSTNFLAVTVEDQYGNAVTNDNSPVTITAVQSGTGFNTAAFSSGATGVATFTTYVVTKATTGTSGDSFIVTSGTLPSVTTSFFAVAPAAYSQLAFATPPADATAGTLATVTVQTQDTYGNATSTAATNVTMSITNAGVTLTGTLTQATNSAGLATFNNLGVTKAGGGYHLKATAGTFTVTSAAFAITPAARAKLAITQQPPDLVAGAVPASGFLTVAVEDQYNNIIAADGANITIALVQSGPSLAGTTTVAVSPTTGVASFSSYSITTASTGTPGDSFTVSASPALPAITSSLFAVAPTTPAALAFTVQPAGTAAHGAVTAQVSALDQYGNVATSFAGAVTVSILGGGTLGGTLTQTASSGVASFGNLFVDTAGTYKLQAAASVSGSATSVASTVFTIVAGPDAALFFTGTVANSTGGATLSGVSVVVKDQYGNQTTSTAPITVALNLNPNGQGTLGGTTQVAAVAGLASFTSLTLDVAATGYQLKASASGLVLATSNTFNVAVGAAAKLAFGSVPSTVIAKSTFTATVVVEDAGGNQIPGSSATVSLALGANPNADTLGGTTTAGTSGGTATFSSLTLSKIGTGTRLVATSGALAQATSSAIAVTFGTAAQIAFTVQPTAGSSGTALSPAVVVAIQDANGNLVTNSASTVNLTLASGPSGGALTGTSSAVAQNGLASFGNLLFDKAGSYTLTASAPSVGAGATTTSASFAIGPGAAAKLVFTGQPSSTPGGQAISPAVAVSVEDAAGNVVTSAGSTSVTIGLASNPGGLGHLTGTLTATTSSGVASFAALTLDKAQSGYQLSASNAVLGTATSSPFAVTVGPAAQLAFAVQPPATVVGKVAFSPAVQVSVLDLGGNLVGSATPDVTLSIGTNPTGDVLSGTTVATAVGGIATFGNVFLNKLHTGYSLRASSGTLAQATSTTFDVTYGAATQIAFTSQPPNGASATNLSPAVAVSVEDANGYLVANSSANVTLSLVQSNGAVLSNGGATPAMSGVAVFGSLNVDKQGTYTLSASAGTLGTATSLPFSITSGPPTMLVIPNGGQPTGGVAAQVLSPSLTVNVVDAKGNLVDSSNAPITLTLSGGPSSTFEAAPVPAGATNGVATFTNLKIDKMGDYVITASSGTLQSISTGTIHIAVGQPAQLAFTVQPLLTQTAGTAMAPPVQVSILDAGGNLTNSTAAVTIALAGNTGVTLLGAPLTKNAVAGVASFASLEVDTAGPSYALTASSGPLTAASSGSFAVIHAAAAGLAFVNQPNTTAAGGPITSGANAPVRVAVLDGFGNVVTNNTSLVTIALGQDPSGGMLLGGPAANVQQAVNGIANFGSMAIDRVGSGYTLVASDGTLPHATSAPFNIVSGAAAQLAFAVQPPAQATSQQAFNVTVAVQDQFGNPVVDTRQVALTLSAAPAGGTLLGGAATPASAGQASFPALSIDKAGGGYVLSAVATPALVPISSATFAVVAGAPAQLVLAAQPAGDFTAGELISPLTVNVVDGAGNLTTSTASIAVALAPHPFSGTLSGTLGKNAAAGSASFADLSIDKASAGYALTVSSGALGGATTTAFSITPAAASQLAFGQVPLASVTAGVAFAPAVSVQVWDRFKNVVTSSAAPVTLALQGAGHLSGETTATASTGLATFAGLSIEKAGLADALVATAPGLSPITSATFAVNPATSSALVFDRSPDKAVAGELVTKVAVSFVDAFGNATTTGNQPVTLALAGGSGATLAGTLTAAPQSGVASFDDLIITNEGKGYTLTASAAALTAGTSAVFDVAPVPFNKTAKSSLGFGCSSTGGSGAAALGLLALLLRGLQRRRTSRGTPRATRLAGAALAFLSLLAVSPARAEPTAAQKARTLFDKAQVLYDLGKYEEAISLYEQAYQTKPAPGLLYNMAQAHRLLGHLDESLRLYRTYLAKVPGAKNREEVEAKIAQLGTALDEKAKSKFMPPNQTMTAAKDDGEPPAIPPSEDPSAPAAPAAASSTPLAATGTPPAMIPSGPASARPLQARPAGSFSDFGVSLAGVVNPTGRTVGIEALAGVGLGASWQLSAGVLVSPHPGGRLQLLYQLSGSDDGAFALSFGPRLLLAPAQGGLVTGGGAGFSADYRLAGWVSAVGGLFAEVVHAPPASAATASGGTVFAPLVSIGLRIHP